MGRLWRPCLGPRSEDDLGGVAIAMRSDKDKQWGETAYEQHDSCKPQAASSCVGFGVSAGHSLRVCGQVLVALLGPLTGRSRHVNRHVGHVGAVLGCRAQFVVDSCVAMQSNASHAVQDQGCARPEMPVVGAKGPPSSSPATYRYYTNYSWDPRPQRGWDAQY